MSSGFSEWDGDEIRSSYNSANEFNHAGFPTNVNPPGRMYGVLQPFSIATPIAPATVPNDASESIHSSHAPLVQSPPGSLRPSHSPSSSGPSEATSGRLGISQNFHFSAPYTPLSNAPHVYGTTSILPSSPLIDSHTSRRSHTVPQTESRPRNLYETTAHAQEPVAGSKRRRSVEGGRVREGMNADDLHPQLEL